MSTIMGVHGISNQHLGRHQLLDSWSPALRDGLERATGQRAAVPDLDLAFYGDLFLPPIPVGARDKGDRSVREVFDDLDDEELADLAEAAGELVSEAEIAAAATEAKGHTRVPRGLQAVGGAIGAKFGAAAVVLFFGDLRQVRRYLRDPAIKAAVDERVAAAVPATCPVLIGHSLGSVVAYEYVRQHPERRLPLLVTLGSPLGLRMVRRWLPEPTGGTPGAELRDPPAQVGQWTNVYDRRDPVACASPLRRWWRGVHDVIVDNGGDAHSATRYLGKRATGAPIAATLAQLS